MIGRLLVPMVGGLPAMMKMRGVRGKKGERKRKMQSWRGWSKKKETLSLSPEVSGVKKKKKKKCCWLLVVVVVVVCSVVVDLCTSDQLGLLELSPLGWRIKMVRGDEDIYTIGGSTDSLTWTSSRIHMLCSRRPGDLLHSLSMVPSASFRQYRSPFHSLDFGTAPREKKHGRSPEANLRFRRSRWSIARTRFAATEFHDPEAAGSDDVLNTWCCGSAY